MRNPTSRSDRVDEIDSSAVNPWTKASTSTSAAKLILKSLDLSGNRIGEAGARALIESGTLKWLDLRNNDVPQASIDDLAGLAAQKSLTVLLDEQRRDWHF